MFHVKHSEKRLDFSNTRVQDKGMAYSIFVFNHCSLGEVFEIELERDLKKVSFVTLCAQYGLDPRLIPEALENLDILSARSDVSPFFLVRYKLEGQNPIVVFQQKASFPEKIALLKSFVGDKVSHGFETVLDQTCCVFQIELEETHLRDMGLLLGYEIARWLSFRGKGLVMDLQGAWYRINAHQAFIPFGDQ